MTGNPLIDDTPKPPAVLMRDGKWIVGPEQRPKGWEKLPIRDEFRESVTAGTPNESLEVQIENVAPTPAPVEKPETKWGDMIAAVLALPDKVFKPFEVPDGIDRPVYIRNFRAILSTHKEARHIKWSIFTVAGTKDKITVGKAGYWPTYKQHLENESAKETDNISPDCSSPEPGATVPCALKELLREVPAEPAGVEALCGCGKPLTHRGWCSERSKRSTVKAVERQALRRKTAKDAQIIPESIPVPVAEYDCPPCGSCGYPYTLKNAQSCGGDEKYCCRTCKANGGEVELQGTLKDESQTPTNEQFTQLSERIGQPDEAPKESPDTYRCPLAFITDLPVESPLLQEFVTAGLRYWGTLDQVALEEPEWDHYACELLPNLAHEVELYRDASSRATATISEWLKESKLGEWTCDFEDGFQPELRVLWAKVQSAILGAVKETEARQRK